MASPTNRLQVTPIDGEKSPVRFIKRPRVKNISGLSDSEIYRRMATGKFPKQVALGPKCVVWVEAEVFAWCEARIAEGRKDS